MGLQVHQILRLCGIATVIIVNVVLIILAGITLYQFWWSTWVLELLHIGFSPSQHLFGWVIALQITLIVVAFFGIASALLFNLRFLILVYTVGVVLLLVVQVVIGTIGMVDHDNRDENDNFLRRNLVAIITKQQNTIHSLDKFQSQYGCCGIHSYEDYRAKPGSWPKSVTFNYYPESCCEIPKCDYAWYNRVFPPSASHYKQKSCYKILRDIYFANLGGAFLRFAVLYGFLEMFALVVLWMCQDWYFDYYGDERADDEDDYYSESEEDYED